MYKYAKPDARWLRPARLLFLKDGIFSGACVASARVRRGPSAVPSYHAQAPLSPQGKARPVPEMPRPAAPAGTGTGNRWRTASSPSPTIASARCMIAVLLPLLLPVLFLLVIPEGTCLCFCCCSCCGLASRTAVRPLHTLHTLTRPKPQGQLLGLLLLSQSTVCSSEIAACY
jgi:hypothetical protein